MPGPNPIPLEALAILGITSEEATANGMHPTMMSFDESYAASEQLLKDKGISKEQYADIHNQVLKRETDNAKSYFKTGVTPLALAKANISPDAVLPIDPANFHIDPKGYRLYQAKDEMKSRWKSGMYDSYGNSFKTKNPEQEAEDYGVFIDEKGQEQPLSTYQAINHLGERFRIDENGNKKMLVLKTNEPGLNMKYGDAHLWVEKDAKDLHTQSITRSMYGPKKVTSSALRNLADNAMNTWIDSTTGSAGTIAEVIGAGMDALRGDGKTGIYTEWGRQMQNDANVSKSKISEFAETQGIFDSATGFAGVLGNVGTQVASAMTISTLGGGLGLLAGGGKAATGLAKGSSYLFGAGYASHVMNQEGLEMGIEEGDRLKMAVAAGFVTLMAEKALDSMGASGFVNRAFGNKTSKEKIEELASTKIRETLTEFAPALRAAGTEAEKEAVRNTIVQKSVGGIYTALGIATVPFKMMGKAGQKVLQAGGKGGVLGNIASVGMEEGMEEVFEEFGVQGLKFFHDNFMAEDGSFTGRGMYGSEMPSVNSIIETFAGGFLGGSIGGIARSMHKPDAEVTNNLYSELAMNYTKEDAQELLKQQYRQGALDNPLLNENDELIAAMPTDLRANAQSKNDIALKAALDQLDLAYQTKDLLGLQDASKIATAMGGDNALAKEALKLAMDEKYYGSVHSSIESRLKDTQDPYEKQQLEKQKTELEQLMQDKSKKYKSILDGTLFAQYQSTMIGNAALINSNVKKQIDSAKANNTKLNANVVMQQAVAEAEKDKDFNNQHKAYIASQTLKNMSQQDKIVKEKLAQEKADFDFVDEQAEKGTFDLYDTAASLKYQKGTAKNFSDVIGQLSALSASTQKGGFTQAQAARANTILKWGREYAQKNLDLISNAFEKMKLGEGETKPDVEWDAYEQMATFMGDQSPYTREQAADLVNLSTAAEKDFDHKKFTEEFIFVPQGKTVQNEKKQNILTHLLDVNPQNNFGKEEYIRSNGKGEVEPITKAQYNDTVNHEAGWNYEKLGGDNAIVIDNLQSVAADGTPILQKTVREGMKLSAYDKAMSDNIRMSSTGQTFDEELGEIDNNLRTGVIFPTPAVINKVKSLKQELENKMNALTLLSNLRFLRKEGYQVTPNVVKEMGLDTWDNVPSEVLDMNKNLLFTAKSHADIMLGMMSQMVDNRKSEFERVEKETNRIDAEIHNLLSKALTGDAYYVNGKKERIKENRPALLNVDDEKLKAEDVAKAKAYWHIYFNTTNEKGEFINANTQEVSNFIIDQIGAGDPNGRKSFNGMFQSDLSDFTLDRFRQFSDVIGKGTDTIFFREQYLFHYLTSVFSTSPLSQQSALLSVLDIPADGKITEEQEQTVDGKAIFPGEHTPEQLNILHTAFAHANARHRMKTDQAFKKAYIELWDNVYENGWTDYYAGVNNQHILLIPGNAGAGKTTYITNTLSMMLKNSLGLDEVIVVAPTQPQLDNLIKGATKAGVKHQAFLFEEFKDKYKELKGKTVFIDEYSLMNPDFLNPIVLDSETLIDDSNTVFILGDNGQSPPSADRGSVELAQFLANTPNLATVMRTGYVDISNMQAFLRSRLGAFDASDLTIPFNTKFKQTAEKWEGVKRYNTYEDMKAEALKRPNAVLIVFDETDRANAIAEGFKETNVKTIGVLENSPQGAEFNEVFVYLPKDSITGKYRDMDDKAFVRYLLTSVSRAENFLGVVMDGKDSIDATAAGIEVEKTELNKDELRKKKTDLYNKTKSLVDSLGGESSTADSSKKSTKKDEQPSGIKTAAEKKAEEKAKTVLEKIAQKKAEDEARKKAKEEAALLKNAAAQEEIEEQEAIEEDVEIDDNQEGVQEVEKAGDSVSKSGIPIRKGTDDLWHYLNPNGTLGIEVDEADLNTNAATEIEQETIITDEGTAVEVMPTVTYVDSLEGLPVIQSVSFPEITIAKGISYLSKDGNSTILVTGIKQSESGEHQVIYKEGDKNPKTISIQKFRESVGKMLLDADQEATLYKKLISRGELSLLGHYPSNFNPFNSIIPYSNEDKHFLSIKYANKQLVWLNQNKGGIFSPKLKLVYHKELTFNQYDGQQFKASGFTIELKEQSDKIKANSEIKIGIDNFTPFATIPVSKQSTKDEEYYAFLKKLADYAEIAIGLDKTAVNYEFNSDEIGDLTADSLNIQPAYLMRGEKEEGREMTLLELMSDADKMGLEYEKDGDGGIKIVQGVNEDGFTKMTARIGKVGKFVDFEVESKKLSTIDTKAYFTQLVQELNDVTDASITGETLAELTHFYSYNMSQINADAKIKDSYVAALDKAGVIYKPQGSDTYELKVEKKDNGMVSWANTKLRMLTGYNIMLDAYKSKNVPNLRYSTKIKDLKGERQEIVTKGAEMMFTVKRRGALLSGTVGVKLDYAALVNRINEANADFDEGEVNYSKDYGQDVMDLKEYNASQEEANIIMRDILGEEHFKERGGFKFAREMFSETGERIHGFIDGTGAMTLNQLEDSKIASLTAYHELMHYIDGFLLDDKAKQPIYDEIKVKTGMEGKAAMEFLADTAAAWMNKRHKLKGWSKMFRHFMDWVANIFNRLGSLLGYRAVMEDFFYNVYYRKAYANAPLLREEAPDFDLLYAKDRRTPFEPVKKAYPKSRPALAHFATEKVISKMAIRMTRPDLTGKYIKGDMFDFDNILSDLEYDWRSLALFELIKENPLQTIAASQSLIGKELTAEDLKPKPYFRYKLKAGKLDSINDVLELEYLNKQGIYVSAFPDADGRWFNQNKEIRRNFRLIHKNMLGDLILSNESYKNTSDTYDALDSASKEKYIAYTTLDDTVLFGMIQQYFPGINLGDPYGRTGGLFYAKFRQKGDIVNYMESVQHIVDTVSKKENAETSPMERQSDLVKFALNTIHRIAIEEDINGNLVERQTGRYVDSEEMNSLLETIGSKVYPMSDIEKNLSDLDLMAKRIADDLETYKRSKESNEGRFIMKGDVTVEHLLSVNDHYFDTNKLTHYSILKLWERYKYAQMLKSIKNDAKSNQDGLRIEQEVYNQYQKLAAASGQATVPKTNFERNLEGMAQVSNTVLAGITTHYKNVGPVKQKKVVVYGKYHKVSETNAATADETYYKIINSFKNLLIDSDGDITPQATRLFVEGKHPSEKIDRKSRISVKSDGIYWLDPTDVAVKIIAFNPNGVFADALKGNPDAYKVDRRKVIDQFMGELGYKLPYSATARLGSYRFKQGDIGFEDFIEIAGSMITSSYIYANENLPAGKVSPNGATVTAVKDVLTKHVGNNVYGQGTTSKIRGIGNTEDSDDDSGEKTQFFPSFFTTEVGTLSDLLLRSGGGRYAKFFYDVNGRKVMLTTLTDTIGKKMRDGNSKAMAQQFQAKFKDRLKDIETHNVMGGNILNPILSDKDKGAIVNTYVIGGFETRGRGVSIDQMTERDNLDLYWSMFTDNLFGNFYQSNAEIQLTNQSERSRQRIVDFNMRVSGLTSKESNGLLMRNKVGDRYVYNLDKDTILHHIYKNFLIQEKAQIRSLNKWVRFMNAKNEREKFGFDMTSLVEIDEVEDLKDLEAIALMREHIQMNLKNIQGQIEKSKLKETDFFGYDIHASHDYVIYTGANAGIQPIHIGWDATMNSPLYIKGLGYKQGPSNTLNGKKFNKKWDMNTGKASRKGVSTAEILAKLYAGDNLEGNGKDMLINEFFESSFSFNHALAAEQGHQMPAEHYGVEKGGYVRPGMKTSSGKYSEIWKAMIIGHQLVNDYVAFSINSTVASETDYKVNTDNRLPVNFTVNNNKRLAIISSPMSVPTIGTYHGLDYESDYLVVSDPRVYAKVMNAFANKEHSGKVDLFDGMGYRNPLVRELQFRSMGKEFGMMNRSGMVKQTANDFDDERGYVSKRKYALDTITGDSLEFMPMQEQMLQLMLNPTNKPNNSLYHQFVKFRAETGDFNEAVQKLADFYEDRRFYYKSLDKPNPYKYLADLVFSSSKKEKGRSTNEVPFQVPFEVKSSDIGSKKFMMSDGNLFAGDILQAYQSGLGENIYNYTQKQNHEAEGVQLNANRKIEDTTESPMTQLISIVLASPEQNDNGETKEAVKLLSSIVDKALDAFNKLLDTDKSFSDKLAMLTPEEFLTTSGFEIPITEEEQAEARKLEHFVMQLADKALTRSDDASVLSRLISDKLSDGSYANSVDFAGVKTRAYQYIAAYMRDKVIKRKMSGQRLMQATGNLIELVEYIDENGKLHTFSKARAEQYAKRKGIPFNPIVKNNPIEAEMFKQSAEGKGVFIIKPLDYMRIDWDGTELTPSQKAQMDLLINEPNEQYKLLRQWGKLKVYPGQIIIPSARFEQFNIPRTTKLDQVFRIWDGNDNDGWNEHQLEEMATVDRKEDLIKYITELAQKNIGVEINTKADSSIPAEQERVTGASIEYLSNSKIAIGENPLWDLMYSKISQQADIFIADELTKLYRQLRFAKRLGEYNQLAEEKIQEMLDKAISLATTEYAEQLIAIKATLEALSVRTPSGPGSGSLHNVVGFINDNGSTGYYNTMKNFIDGSDQDIDQNTVYFKNATNALLGKDIEEPTEDEQLGDISNEILDFLFRYYKNPLNDGFTQAPIQLKDLEDAAKDAPSKVFKGYENANDLALSMMYRVSTFAGQIVGPFALAQKGQTFVYRVSRQDGDVLVQGINNEDGSTAISFFNSLADYQQTPILMESLVNGATDNPKLQLLGVLNITHANADMVAAMVFLAPDVLAYMTKRGTTFANATDAIMKFLKTQAHGDVMNVSKRQQSVNNSEMKQTTYAIAAGMLDNITKNKDILKQKLDRISNESNTTLAELKGLLSGLGFTSEELDSTFKEDEDGNFIAIRDWSDKKGMKQAVYRMLSLIDDKAQVEKEQMEVEGETEAKEKVLSDEDAQKLAADANAETDEKEVEKGLAARIVNLRYRLINNQDRMRDIKTKLSHKYQSDLFQIAKYSMFGDFQKGIVRIVNVNQGTANSTYDMKKYEDNIKFMTGYRLDELLVMYDHFKELQAEDASLTASQYLNNNGLANAETIGNDAFSLYKHRIASDSMKHLNFDLINEEQSLNYRNMFHKLGNVTAMLFSDELVMSHLKTVGMQKYVDTRIFSTSLPIVQAKRNQVLEDAGLDQWNEFQWNTFHEEVDKYLISDFFKSSEELFSKTSRALEDGKIRPMMADATNRIGAKLDLTTPTGRYAFVLNFPKYFMDEVMPVLETNKKMTDATQKFLRELEVITRNNISYLVMKNPNSYNDNNITEFQEGYATLPTEVKDIITFYQIAKDGFAYKSGAFAKIIDTKLHRDFSDYMRNLKESPYAYNENFFNDLDVFVESMLGHTELGLLKSEERIKKLDGTIDYIPPKAAYGFARKYYATVNFQWTAFGPQKIIAYAKQTGSSGFAYSRNAGNNIEVGMNSNHPLSPYNMFDVNGHSLAAKFNMQDKGFIQRELAYRIELEAKRLNIDQNQVNSTEILNDILQPTTFNAIAKKYEYRQDKYEKDKMEKYKYTDADGKEGIDYIAMRTDLYNTYKGLIVDYIKKHPQLFYDLTEDKIFTDKNLHSVLSPAYILSNLANEYKMYLASGKSMADAVSMLGTVDESEIKAAAQYDMFRNQYSTIANSYDYADDGLVNMNPKYVTQSLIPFMEEIFPTGTITEPIARAILLQYNMRKEVKKSDLTIADIQTIFKEIFKSEANNKYVNDKNIDQWREVLNKTSSWIEFIDADRMSDHLRILDAFLVQKSETSLESASPSTIKRRNAHAMRIGDRVHFSDGNVGIITQLPNASMPDEKGNVKYREYKYVLLLSESKSKHLIQKSKMTVADFAEQSNAAKGLVKFTKLIAKSMPNVKFQFISQEQADEMAMGNANSFVKNGKVYINTDRADRGVALHEFGHTVALAMERENPELFRALVNGLKGTPLYNRVKNLYPELVNERDLMHEVIPTFLQQMYYQKDHDRKQKSLFRQILDWFKSYLKRLVGLGQDSAIDALDLQTASIQDMADAILDDMIEGRIISNMDTSELADLMPYALLSKPINISNLEEAHISKVGKQGEEKQRQIIINRVNSTLRKGKFVYVGLNGKEYNLKENRKDGTVQIFYTKNVFDRKKRDEYIRTTVVNEELKAMDKPGSAITNFLTKVAADEDIFAAASKTFRKGWKERFKATDTEDIEVKKLQLNEMLNMINFNKNYDVATSLSDTKTLETYGLSIDASLVGEDPIVIIHDAKNDNAKAKRVSIFYVTVEKLNSSYLSIKNDGTTATRLTKQGESYLDKTSKNQVHLLNTIRDMNASKATLQAMALKSNNPNIHIQRVGSLSLYGDGGNSKGYEAHFKYMPDMVEQMKLIYGNENLNFQLDPAIKMLLSNVKLIDRNTYKLNLVQSLYQYASTKLAEYSSSQESSDKKAAIVFKSMLDEIKTYEEKYNGTYGVKLAKLVLNRMNYIRHTTYAANPNGIYKDDEYLELADNYRLLMDKKTGRELPVDELGYFEKWWQTADRFDDDIRNWIFNEINIGLNRTKEVEIDFVEKNKVWIDNLNKENPMLKNLKDNSRALFEPLFKKKTVKILDPSTQEVTGEQVVSLMEIHWNKDAQDTREALENSSISPLQVEYGKFLMDFFEKEFESYLYDKNFASYTQDMHKLSLEEKRKVAKAAAKQEVQERWEKGMLPAMTRRYTDAMAQGQMADAFQLFMGDISRDEGVFEQYYEGETSPNAIRYKYLASHFWDQFKSASEMGSESRLKQIGLTYHNGELVLIAPDNQRNMSFDLQSIGNYTIGASARARNLDDSIDAINIALDTLNGQIVKKGVKTTDVIEQLRVYTDRNIFGTLPTHGKASIGSVTFMLDDAMNAANKLTTSIAMALSPLLGIKNFVASEIKMWANALANDWANNGWFTTTHITEAIQEVVSNMKKVEAINKKYQLVAMSERDVLNHALYNQTRRTIAEGDTLMMANFAGDYINQLIAAVAQMKADGTWDAHDDDGNYQHTKDTRFYQDGKMTEDADLIMNSIKQDLIREKRHGQHYEPDGNLKAAYNHLQTNRIKVLIQRYVAEITDSQYKDMANAYGIVRIVMSLKNFMKNVAHEWLQKTHYESSLGKLKVATDEFGKKEVVWDPMLVEGVAITLFSAFKQLKDYRGDFGKTWNDLSDHQKRNLAKMLSFSIFIGGVYALLNMLNLDDEEDKAAWKTTLNYLLLNSARENLSQINPYQLVVDWRRSPNPLMMQVENYENILAGTVLLPYEAYTEGMGVSVDNWIYQVSKGVPGGAAYRDVRKVTDDFIDGMLETMTNKNQE